MNSMFNFSFNFKKFSKFFFFSSTTLLLGSSFTYKKYKTLHNSSLNKPPQINSLPTYTRRQVQDHCTKESRIWLTFRDGVYDVTEWMEIHPGGGDKIMMVAGGSLDAFWEMYAFHKKPEIFEVLEKYRIGNLNPQDIIDPKTLPNFDHLKKENMTRSEDLLKLQTFPYCAECPSDKLVKFFYTPNEYFFVRNHNTVPMNLAQEDYKFQVINQFNNKKLKLTIDDLKNKYPRQSVETIIMCTGNRRSQMNKPATPKGLSWNVGSIANGIWDGVLVRDLLKEIGFNKENCKGLHLIVNGLDKDFQGSYYSISIPLEYAFREDTDVILAYGYNNGEIPYEHGYPLRLIVPGVVGVRNVKWIKNIEISDKESQGAFQQRDYKIIPNNVDVEKVDLTKLPALMEHVVNSAIVEPKNGSEIKQGEEVIIKGWAIGHFGAKLSKIEISFDQGKTWNKVDKLKFNENNKGKVFGWTLWEYPVNTKNLKEKNCDVWVRAEDVEGNIQPVNSEDIWNFRGLMNNSIHKISINIL
jgi:sulfite oxidase